MEHLNRNKLIKINHPNINKNQKKVNNKSCVKNEHIKISDNSNINGLSKNNNQKMYNKNFILNSNSIFKSNIHNNKTNSLNN